MQETRCRGDWAEVVDNYFVVSAAAAKGHYGTELWFHKRLGVSKQTAWRIASEPRLLVVRAPLEEEECLFAAANAPHSQPQWWEELPAKLAAWNRDDLPIVMMVDANAKVGSKQSAAVGPAAPEEENEAG